MQQTTIKVERAQKSTKEALIQSTDSQFDKIWQLLGNIVRLRRRDEKNNFKKIIITEWNLSYNTVRKVGPDHINDESQTVYQCRERVPLHVKSFQKRQTFILQQIDGKSVQVPVIQKEGFVTLLFGDENSFMEFNCHF